MPLKQSSTQGALQRNIAAEITAGKAPAQAAAIGYSVQKANDYVPQAVAIGPESLSPAEINSINRKYWASAGGEQTGGK